MVLVACFSELGDRISPKIGYQAVAITYRKKYLLLKVFGPANEKSLKETKLGPKSTTFLKKGPDEHYKIHR